MGYKEIDLDYFSEKVYNEEQSDNFRYFNDAQIKKLKTIISDGIFTFSSPDDKSLLIIKYKTHRFFIYQLKDEWFYVSDRNRSTGNKNSIYYYECDQFEGLVNCLKMLKENAI